MRRAKERFRTGGIALACLLSALTTGCSSGSGGDDSPSPLMAAVGHVSVAGATGAQVSYLDADRVRSLEKGDSQRFRTIGRPGNPLLSGYRFNAHAYGLDPAMIDTDVTNGYAGHWDGSFDADRITAKLKAGGFARSTWHGETTWKKEGITLRVGQDELSFGFAGKDLSSVRPAKGKSLADDPDYQALDRCLGDVYRVDFGGKNAKSAVRLSATGQLAKSAKETSGVICALTDGKRTAERAADRLKSVIGQRAPRFDGAKVTVLTGDSPGVKVTVPDRPEDKRAGRLLTSNIDLQLALSDL
ncbi:hypothetical protein SSPO_074320 [Streptomyces antimycoticus]|uniref:Lipoprotein n=1 Tax=Streptomyces antimycoticus TaxID=68175 RepID=A0A499URZ4_9ACTN|nr:hypothetical protein [Streptomyces antimycoticus]BBJ44714.1 hypothetical protein SSPO_074320 [Streptomyces antimycoticus]